MQGILFKFCLDPLVSKKVLRHHIAIPGLPCPPFPSSFSPPGGPSLACLWNAQPMTWLYGGDRPDDDAAIKAAGLELQGLCTSTTATITSLHHPLIALVRAPAYWKAKRRQ